MIMKGEDSRLQFKQDIQCFEIISPGHLPNNLTVGTAGPNGSGKSNFIGVFAFLHAIREGRLNDYVRKASGAEQVLHFGSKITEDIQILVSFRKEINQYKLTLKPTTDDSLYPSGEWVSYWDRDRYSKPLTQQLNARENGQEAGHQRFLCKENHGLGETPYGPLATLPCP